ncbi:MAG: methyl-accepting chemotaxis protein [Nitrospirae bacterium]|nr:methyl-accepting chemotaxis protein [Nitrospirota bacterium]MBF0534787.1 methyl-accepting chemotaxis protein [Nitrospirota bacterium]MBF0616461.1 methyl-accepting chemotaxis protein [Nitrospirota bacterium]
MNVKMPLKMKLFALFILIGMIPFTTVGIYSYSKTRDRFVQKTLDKLVGMRELKKSQVEQYFSRIIAQASTLSESRMTVDAMKEFSSAFSLVDKESGARYDSNQKHNDDQLMVQYQALKDSIPDLPDNIITSWWPQKKTVKALQNDYISGNPYPIGGKDKLDFAAGDNTYNAVHKKYHKIFRNYAKKFGYYDIFLIDTEGYIVYTEEKELDFATNIVNGPYSDSNLAKAFDAAIKSKEKGFTKIVDYDHYIPSKNAAAGFIAAPIFDGDKKIGVLAFQMPIGRVNDIMTNNKDWKGVGLGNTGECYLVGDDFHMKTDSRALIESRDTFINTLQKLGVDRKVTDDIKRYNSTIETLQVKIPDVKESLNGITDSHKGALSYLNVPVLIAHAPVNAGGLKWVIILEEAESQALVTSHELKKFMWILGIITAICVLAASYFISRALSVPLNKGITSISSSTTEISSTVEQHERTAAQQASAVNETTTTMDELSASFKQSSEQARTASDGAGQVLVMVNDGSLNINEMLYGMTMLKERVEATASKILQLSEKTTRIESIAAVVSDFANETKMLAMNAAVEAVRAGEHGKGFSVVAMEIRKLAEQSKKSAEEITEVVAEIQKATNSTVMVTEESTKTVDKEMELAENTAETFNKLTTVIRSSAENIQQIFLNIQQQSAAISQVVDAMSSINRGVKETSAGITQTKLGIKNLNEVAKELKEMV